MRSVRLLLLVVVALVACASVASAASPPGPRLATVQMIHTKGSEREENASAPFVALTTIGPTGEKRRYLLKERMEDGKRVAPFPPLSLDSSPSWSADGSAVAFLGLQGKRRGIYLAEADGSRVRFLKGTAGRSELTYNPVLSPDGQVLVFARWRTRLPKPPAPTKAAKRGSRRGSYFSTTTWIVSLSEGRPQRLTPWREGLDFVPSSFSPDGSILALTKDDEDLEGPSVVLMAMDGSGSRTVIELAEEPAISPDGSRLAFVGYKDQGVFEEDDTHRYSLGELYVANIDGGGVKRLTRTDTVAESAPSWDPSGSRIAYVGLSTETKYFSSFDFMFPQGNSLMQINADGTCPMEIFSSSKVANYGVAWQPGPGRGAGPIEC